MGVFSPSVSGEGERGVWLVHAIAGGSSLKHSRISLL